MFLVAYMVLTQAIKSLNRTKDWYLEQEGILQPSGVKFSTKIHSPSSEANWNTGSRESSTAALSCREMIINLLGHMTEILTVQLTSAHTHAVWAPLP